MISEAKNNDEHPVGREVAPEHVQLAAQVVGQEDARRLVAEDERAPAIDTRIRPMENSTCASSPEP